MRDIFGNEVAEDEARQKVKARDPQPNGYAAMPGTGPAGETCRTCKHLTRETYAKTYLKCQLMIGRWTKGTATDIRAKSPACRRWEAAQ